MLVTAAVTLLLLGSVHAGSDGWLSGVTLALLLGGVLAVGAFVAVERRVASPLVLLNILRSRSLMAANVLAALLRAALFSWFFFAALYMHRVLGFSALDTGLGFLPATIVIGGLYPFAARLVARHGARLPFVAGTVLLALGLVVFAGAPVDGSYAAHVLPAMLLTGCGGGLLFLPLILTATTSVDRVHAGQASGLVNTSQQLGGALGLAVLASMAATRTGHLRATHSTMVSLIGGFHLAFTVSAALAALCVAVGAATLPSRPAPAEAPTATHQPAQPSRPDAGTE